MTSIKLSFQVSHTLADTLTYELMSLGSQGTATVDKTELVTFLLDKKAISYAADEYLESLPEQAQVEAYFLSPDDVEQMGDTTPLLINYQEDYSGEYMTAPAPAVWSLAEVLSFLEEKMSAFRQDPGDSYRFLQAEVIHETDWSENWKQYYEPVALSSRVTVCPSWLDYEPAGPQEIVLRLDPGSAFGTGYHESTALCVFYLDELSRLQPDFLSQAKILDLGTGSGILALTLAYLGASQVDAIDIDPHAVEVARQNFMANGFATGDRGEGAPFTLYPGELRDTEGKYDLLVANLIADLHVNLASTYTEKLEDQGYLLLSGIIEDKYQHVREAFQDLPVNLVAARMQHDWWTLVYQATTGC